MIGFRLPLFAAGFLLAAVSPGFAAHANPWATAEDTVLSKNHDDKQARSLDTPGEDEMKGQMTRSAHGKTDDDVASGGGGVSASADAGQSGGKSGAGAGHGRR
jgi:hypothetical protein